MCGRARIVGTVMTDDTEPRPPRRTLHYTPALPIQVAPYWDWPLRPLASLADLLRSRNPVGLRCLFLIGVIITWTFFTPALSRAETLSLDWIADVWLRNFAILVAVAGGLHLLLWRFGVQGDTYRYDLRPMMSGTRAFWFRSLAWTTFCGPSWRFSSGPSGSASSGTPTPTAGRR